MSVNPAAAGPVEQAFEIHGVRVALEAPDQGLLERIVALLPSNLAERDAASVEDRYALKRGIDHSWYYTNPAGGFSSRFLDLDLVIAMLDRDVRGHIASHATDRVFVHAGAVAHDGRAVVIPGASFSGKSTLVEALVRAGAEYYSDEFAVLDLEGRVHPYARPLSMRTARPLENEARPAESLGGTSGVAPVPVGLIALTTYNAEATFRPERRSAAQGIMGLLSHTGRARDYPQQTMAAVRKASSTAVVVEGERGEADVAADVLLELAGRAIAEGHTPAR